MPYQRIGKTVYKKEDGLTKVGKSKSTFKAEAYRRLLEGLHSGKWKPTGKPSTLKKFKK